MNLLTSQREEVGRILRDEGVEPTDFEWESDGVQSVLRSKSDSWWFAFGRNAGRAIVLSWHPGLLQYEERAVARGFEDVSKWLTIWARSIHRESRAADPWSVARGFRELLGEDDTLEDNTLYSADEQVDVLSAVRVIERQFEELLATHATDNVELKLYVARQFQYLRDELPRRGRREWLGMARDFLVGAASTVAVQLSPEVARGAFEVGRAALRALGGG